MGLLDGLAVGAASGFGDAAGASLAQSQKHDQDMQMMQTKAALDLKNSMISNHDSIDYKNKAEDAQKLNDSIKVQNQLASMKDNNPDLDTTDPAVIRTAMLNAGVLTSSDISHSNDVNQQLANAKDIAEGNNATQVTVGKGNNAATLGAASTMAGGYIGAAEAGKGSQADAAIFASKAGAYKAMLDTNEAQQGKLLNDLATILPKSPAYNVMTQQLAELKAERLDLQDRFNTHMSGGVPSPTPAAPLSSFASPSNNATNPASPMANPNGYGGLLQSFNQ